MAQPRSSNYLAVKRELEGMLFKYGGNQSREFFTRLLVQIPLILAVTIGFNFVKEQPNYQDYIYLLVFGFLALSTACTYYFYVFFKKREAVSRVFLQNERPRLNELSQKYGFTYATKQSPERTLLVIQFGSEEITANLFLGSIS
ncbi:hypothetical protein HY993_05030 [Candidatus Micrarchaeota archaeon]|nr:hypothetical protein [Candidatus Micrarchaeota archaeon]